MCGGDPRQSWPVTRFPTGFDVDCLSPNEEERLDETLLGDGMPADEVLVDSSQSEPKDSDNEPDHGPFADVEVEQDGHEDKEEVLVSVLLDKEKETAWGVEGVVAEQGDDDGTGRTSTTTEHFGTASKTLVDYAGGNEWIPQAHSKSNQVSLRLPDGFHPTCQSDFSSIFFSPDVVDTKCSTPYYSVANKCNRYQTCLCDEG